MSNWSLYTPYARPLCDEPGAPLVELVYRYPTVAEMRRYTVDSYTAGDQYVPPVPGEVGEIKKKLAWMNDTEFIRFQHGARLVASLRVGGESISCPDPEAWLAFFEKDARYVWLIESDAVHLFRRAARGRSAGPGPDEGARDVRAGDEAGDGKGSEPEHPDGGAAPLPELPVAGT